MSRRARQLRQRDAKSVHKLVRRLPRIKDTPRLIAEVPIAARIVTGLNEHPASASSKRVSRFIHLFNRARDLTDSFRLFFESQQDMREFLDSPNSWTYQRIDNFGTGMTFRIPEIQALNDQLNLVLTELNKLARRYRWHPLIRHMGYELGGLSAFNITEHWDSKNPDREWETRAIWWLLGQRGKWIDSFRQCRECRRWFFALADHQLYCRDACRKHHASHSDEFKQRRKLYMRQYRRAEKEGAKRAATLARESLNRRER